MTRLATHQTSLILAFWHRAKMASIAGKQMNDTHGGSGGLLLSACRHHLLPTRGGSGGTFAASRSVGKRRRLEQQQQQQHGVQSQAAGDEADGSVGANPTDRSAAANTVDGGDSGGGAYTGPFRVLLTTYKTPSSTDTADASSGSSKDIQNRKAAAAAGNARLLSSVAMDLAHSLALQSSSSSASSASRPPCRGCGASNGTSNTRNRPCQCIDVVYILYEAASSAGGGSAGGDQTLAAGGGKEHGGDDVEEDLGADLFPLRCRRVDNCNDTDDAEDSTDPATNSRPPSSQPSSPSWDEGALSRIQIRRMRDGTDLVRYLATVPLLPPHQQPRKGIVLNDIGSFVLGNTSNGNGGGGGGTVSSNSTQSVASGPYPSPSSSLGAPYYTIDSSIVLTQILSILDNTADYLDRQRRKALESVSNPPGTNATECTSDDCHYGDGFSLLVTMDGDAYSQLPPHIKPVLQNWLPIVGTLRSKQDDADGLNRNGANAAWSLDLKREGWRLPGSFSDGPTATCCGAASCTIKQSQESADGMPEIFWSVKV